MGWATLSAIPEMSVKQRFLGVGEHDCEVSYSSRLLKGCVQAQKWNVTTELRQTNLIYSFLCWG